jgi:hypothetical protein
MFWAVFPSDPCTIIVFVSSLTRRRSSNSDISRVGRCATIVIMMILSVPERAANADAGAHASLMGAGGKRWRTEHALQSYGAEIEAHRVHLSRTGCGVAGDHLPEHRQQSRIFHGKKNHPESMADKYVLAFFLCVPMRRTSNNVLPTWNSIIKHDSTTLT